MAKQTFTTGQVLTAAQMTSLQQTAMGGGSPVTKTTSYVLVAEDAGTVIQMNSASSTSITVNTALFAAGDSVQIQNIGAGVCTVTAGTATVTTAGSLALSQWEGGTLYFTSASAAIFFDIVQSSGMTNPMTTTGDTIYSSSGSTPARLGIGTTGQVLTVASGVPSWASLPSSTPTLVGCQVYWSGAAPSIPAGTYTAIPWNQENFDTNGFHSTTTNNERITIPTGYAGYYLINATIGYDGGTASARTIQIDKNNSSTTGFQFARTTAVSGGQINMSLTTVLNLAVGDYIAIKALQSSSGALDLFTERCNFSAIYLGV